jgi:hypothetical protein
MPLDRYNALLSQTNVVVDQACTYSYGMNTVMALAMGKVVLSGCEPECRTALGDPDCPVINILPDARHIVATIEGLLAERKRIPEIGWRGRAFVERTHAHVKVAEQFVQTWMSASRSEGGRSSGELSI